MLWLQRHSWWGLLAIAVASAWSGLIALAGGVTYQALDVTGKGIADIEAESSAGYQLSEFAIRTDGLHLMAMGVALGAVLVLAFRHDHPWAWWTMWILPLTVLAGSLLMFEYGAAGPATSGAIVGVLATAILAVTAPRFFPSVRRRGIPPDDSAS